MRMNGVPCLVGIISGVHAGWQGRARNREHSIRVSCSLRLLNESACRTASPLQVRSGHNLGPTKRRLQVLQMYGVLQMYHAGVRINGLL